MADTITQFLVGYMLVLASPGPNMLAVGGFAALHGFRATLPLAFGIGLGTCLLASTLYGLAGLVPQSAGWEAVGHAAAAGLLAALGLRVASTQVPADECGGAAARAARADVATGFMTALTNPLTAGFFAAQFLGPVGDLPQSLVGLVLALSAILAFTNATVVAACLSNSAIRQRVRTGFKPWSRIVGALFIGLAGLQVQAVVLLL